MSHQTKFKSITVDNFEFPLDGLPTDAHQSLLSNSVESPRTGSMHQTLYQSPREDIVLPISQTRNSVFWEKKPRLNQKNVGKTPCNFSSKSFMFPDANPFSRVSRLNQSVDVGKPSFNSQNAKKQKGSQHKTDSTGVPTAVYKNKFDNLRVYNYTAQHKKGPVVTLVRKSLDKDTLDGEFQSVALPSSLRHSIEYQNDATFRQDKGQSALSYDPLVAGDANKFKLFSPVNQRRQLKPPNQKESMKVANEYRFQDYMRDLREQGKIGFSDMFSESELARATLVRPESILKTPQSRGSQSGPQAKSSLSVNQKPKSRQSKLSGASQLRFEDEVTIFRDVDDAIANTPMSVPSKQRKSVEFFPRQGQPLNRATLPIASQHGAMISQSNDFKNQTLQIPSVGQVSPNRHMLFSNPKQIGSNLEFSSAAVSGELSVSSPGNKTPGFTPLQQNIRDSIIHNSKSPYIQELDNDQKLNIAFSKLKKGDPHNFKDNTVTMIEKLKEQQRQRDLFIERQLRQNFDMSNSRLHYENDNTARFPEVNMSIDAKTVIRIDPKDSRLCPYNLKYRHVNTIDQFNQMAKKKEAKYATLAIMRSKSRSPSPDGNQLKSESKGTGLRRSSKVESKGTESRGPASREAGSKGARSGITSPQSIASVSPSRQSQMKVSKTTIQSDPYKGYSKASVRFAKIWAARMNPKKEDKTVRQRIGEFEKSLFINQSPQELIKFLDDQIQRRKDKMKVDIVSEACLQKQIFSNHYDIDEFQDQCQKFVEKRLKYRFGDKSKLIYQRLATTHHDCGVQKIEKLAKYKFNLLKDLENEKLEFQRRQKLLMEEQERKAEQERLAKLEAEKAKAALKMRKKQSSKERVKEGQRKKIDRLKKTLSAIPHFGSQIQEDTDGEPVVEEKIILKKDGTPLWVIIDCQHDTSLEELRVQFYNQYKMYIRYLADFELQYKVHLSKNDIIQKLDEHGFYNMQNLSEEEMKLFESKESCIKLLMDPLLHLVKEDLRDFEFAMANPEGLQIPVASSQFDNHDISMYDENKIQTAQGATESKYTITIERRAQEYIDGLRAIFEENDQHIDQLPAVPVHEDKRMKRYIRVYEDYRIHVICQSLHGYSFVEIDSLNPTIAQKRIQTFLEKRKADAKGVLELNFTSFLNEINTWLERYLEECIINKSEHTNEENQTYRNQIETIEDGVASVDNTVSNHSYTANIVTEPSARNVTKKKSSVNVQKQSKLSQREQDMNQNQQIQISVFQNRVQQNQFYNQAKKFHNEVFNNQSEEINLKILKEFENLRAAPTPVCTKIQNNTLILDNESLSKVETQILKKYMELTKNDPKSQVKILKIKDCRLSDKQLSEILEGIESQEKITSLHISNDELEGLTMKPLCKILQRKQFLCLQELSLVRIKKIPHVHLTAFFKELSVHSQISKFTLSHTKVLASNLEAFKYFSKFLKLTKNQILSHSILTHLDLSYLQFSAKQLSKTIRTLTGGQYLQFLSLAGNKLIHIENPKGLNFVHRFNEGLLEFLEHNTNNLTHLNLSDMVFLFEKNDPNQSDGTSNKLQLPSSPLDKNKVLKILQINRILAKVCKCSRSLQVIHLDNNFICLEDKLEIAQKLGCLSYQNDSGQMAQAINQSSLTATLKETYIKKHEANELNFLKKSTVDHLIGENADIEDKIVGQQILKHISVDQNYKKLDARTHLLAEEILYNKFTLQRNLISDKHDLKYSHSHKPFIDLGQSTEKWQLVSEKQQETVLNSKNIMGWQNMCMFCCNLQDVHLYFNYEDDSMVAPEYQEIQNDNVKALIKKWFLNGLTDAKCPVVFGSLTNWKVLEMIPTQLHVLQLLRNKLLNVRERREDDTLNSKNPKNLVSYVNMIFENLDEFKIEQLQQYLTDYIDFLDFDLSQDHFDKMKWANIFSCPSIETPFTKSYFTQLRATPGQHSLIVYDPKTEQYFARNLLVDVRVHNVDIRPQYQEFEQSYGLHNYNMFIAQKVLNYRCLKLMILEDLHPDNTPYLNLKMKIPDLIYFVQNYKLLNDLFIHIAANQKITIMEDFRDSKARLQHLEELESNPVEDDNLIYPTVQSIDVVNLFGQKSVRDRTVVYNRNEFLQYMLKMSLKQEIMGICDITKPDIENETFGFRYFEEFLDNLDPFTQQYLNQNIDVLRSIFMTYSTQQNIWNIEKFSENSYKQFGVIDLQTLQIILELYQPKPEKDDKSKKGQKTPTPANKLMAALGQQLQEQVNKNLEKLGGDQNLTARSNASAGSKQNANLYKGMIYRNRWNYCLKLRAAVGCNIEYTTSEGEITMKGMQMKKDDEIKTILEAKQIADNADEFIEKVVNTKNFEQVQTEKKVQEEYKYIRSRLMTVDFMEFIKIIVIHSVISRQQNTKEIKLPPPTSRNLWRKIETTLKKTKAFSHTIKMKRRIHTEGVTKMMVEHHCKLEPLSDQQIQAIEKYVESPQFRAKIGEHEVDQRNLNLPENYTDYKIQTIKDKKKKKELVFDFKQDDFDFVPDLKKRQKFLAQQGSIDMDNPLELILEGTDEQDEDDVFGSKIRTTRKESKFNITGRDTASRGSSRGMRSGSRGGSSQRPKYNLPQRLPQKPELQKSKFGNLGLQSIMNPNPLQQKLGLKKNVQIFENN